MNNLVIIRVVCYNDDHGYMTGVILKLKQISKSQFKARALEMFRQVESSGESVVITDHGVPSIEIKPYSSRNADPLTLLHGSVVEYRDSPAAATKNEWEA